MLAQLVIGRIYCWYVHWLRRAWTAMTEKVCDGEIGPVLRHDTPLMLRLATAARPSMHQFVAHADVTHRASAMYSFTSVTNT